MLTSAKTGKERNTVARSIRQVAGITSDTVSQSKRTAHLLRQRSGSVAG
jgi:hypothetical protein